MLRFVALGDMPYRRGDRDRFLRLLQRINASGAALAIHLGDVKKAKSRCDGDRYRAVAGMLAEVRVPLVYTPGDNDWADCGNKKAGSFAPLERLQALRQIFCAIDGPLRAPPGLVRQGSLAQPGTLVENARWDRDGVQFVCVHTVGDDNGRGRGDDTDEEYRRRNAQNQAWLEEAFRLASGEAIHALVIATHANLWYRPKRRLQRGFLDTIATIRDGAQSLGKPVLVVHGDKHALLLDQPFGQDVQGSPAVLRLQVPGDRDVRAVQVDVAPAPGVPFSVSPLEP